MAVAPIEVELQVEVEVEVKPVCRKENHFTQSQSQSLGPRLVQTGRQRDINTPTYASEYLRISAPYMAQQAEMGDCRQIYKQSIHRDRAFEINPMAHLRLATSTLHLAQSAYGINRAIKR